MASARVTTREFETASGGIEFLARSGYAAKGAVYLAIGLLSAHAAFTARADGAEGSRGALTDVAGQPFGQVLLVLIAVGLVGYVLWRLVQGIMDPEEEGTDGKGMAKRAAFIISGLIYASLGFWVVQTLLGSRGDSGGGEAPGGGGSEAASWSQTLLSQPWGQWILAAVGVVIIGYAFFEFGRAVSRSYERHLRPDLDGRTRLWAGRIARTGFTARGIVLLLIGGFVIYAAWTADPDEARGLEGALQSLSDQPYGPWLMGLVALGLAAYGLFQLVKARYRRIGPVR